MKHRFAAQIPGLNIGGRAMTAPVSLVSAPLALVERAPPEGPLSSPRRTRLWELSRYLHCSVIGTCLTTSELRHTLAKAGFVTEGATDHDLHGKGVTVAGRQDTASKLLHKALDKRHRQAINQFAKAKNEADVSALWREAAKRGDIPGAYWAALTHLEATDDLVRQMFGEVHMLSHLVGAANVVRQRGDALGKDNWRWRGEDVRAGTVLFLAGHRLRAQDVALAGALGLCQLTVFRRLRVGLFSTGDELCEPGHIRQSGQIWNANRLLLPGLLAPLACDVHDYGIIQDNAHEIEGALLTAARDCDLLITTGGMSVGAEDHIRSIIGRRGSLEVWPLAIKPGRPVGLGDIDDCPILALPRNPIATAIAFIAFGRPIVATLAGACDEQPLTLQLPAGFTIEKSKGIRQFLLADLARGPDGTSIVIPWPQQSPATLSPLAGARGLIVLPESCTTVALGDAVMFVPLDAFLQ